MYGPETDYRGKKFWHLSITETTEINLRNASLQQLHEEELEQ